MANITRMNVMITANAKGLMTGLTMSQKAIASFSKSANRSLTAMGNAFGPAVGSIATGMKRVALGATAAAASLVYLTKTSIDAIGDTNDFAKSLGMSYSQLRTFQFAAQQAGVDSESLNAAFAKMSDTLGTAFGGNTAAIQAFKNIGLSVEQLQRMNPAQQFTAIANAINRIQDPSQKMAAARDIFGKSGGRLISLFENAGQAINQAGQQLNLFGVNLSQLDVSKIDDAGDAMGMMGLVIEGIGNQLARIVSPYIQQLAIDTTAWIESMGGVGPAVDAAFGGAITKLDSILNIINEIKTAWNDFGKNITGGVGWIADKAADIASATGISAAFQANTTENRINHGIAPAHQAEARALIKQRGGFQQEGITARRISNEMNISSRQYAGAANASASAPQYGDSFRAWRDRADGLNATPMAAPQRREREDPMLQVLRNIEANTGKNKIAYAG